MDSRFISLFSNSKDIFFVMDMNGMIFHTNNAFRHTFDYHENELADINIMDICHPADKERKEEYFSQLLADNELIGYQSRIKAKDGRYFNVIWSVILNEADHLIYSSGKCLINRSGISESAIIDILQHTIQALNEGFVVLDAGWHIAVYNPAFQAFTNLCDKEILHASFMQLKSLSLTAAIIGEIEKSASSKKSIQVQYLNEFSNRWLRINIYPYHDQVAAFIRDITEIKIQEWVLALEKKVLELNATSLYTLAETTTELLIGIEAIFPDMLCSVLEVDDEQKRMYSLAAPRLPQAYCDQLEGLEVAPDTGSCGKAAYHREQVIVSDIERDPLWKDYADRVRPFGLKACWSTPVMNSKGSKVLATFGIYYTSIREPSQDELNLIERTVNILRVLIESKKTEENIREQNTRLHTIASVSSHELRRPVATILGLVNLFDSDDIQNPLNREIISHLGTTTLELDEVIHNIVEKTIYAKENG